MDKITFNRDKKFDIQLGRALNAENQLAEILAEKKIELKTETWQWEQTGNIAIEYACDGKPSGLAVTEADFWVHELRRGNDTLVYLMFPIARLKELAAVAYRAGRRRRGGDDARFDMVILSLAKIFK